ncbi:ATP-binding cassette domain-containing protein, partial [Candidatus Bathyarchaeota archaeon]
MGQVAVKVEGLRKAYGEIVAVKDVNLEVMKGEIFGLLGPNGAGKSTLMGVLAGVLSPDKGKIEILGYDYAKDLTKIKSLVSFMPQEGV